MATYTGGSAPLPISSVPEAYQPTALENQQQQRMAQLLMQQAMQGQPQGQMISGHYVKPSWAQQLAPVANQALAMYANYQADKGQLDLAKAIREGDRAAMADYMATKEGKPAVMENTELAGPYAGNVPMPVASKEISPAVLPNARGAYANLYADPRASARLQDFAFTKMNEGPIKAGLEDVLLDPITLKPIYQGAGKLPATLDVAVSLIPNLPRNRNEWTDAQRKQVENKVMQLEAQKASKTVFNISDIMGKDIGQIKDILEQGRTQVQSGELALGAANKLDQAIKSGNLNVGPTANVGQYLGQLGDSLGFVNQKGQEKLVNTRQALQGLAQMWASERSQAKGQGTLTEGENALYGKISSGNLNEISIPELKYMVESTKNKGNYYRSEYENKLNVLRKNPKFADVIPLYEVGSMPTVQWNTGPKNSQVVNDALSIVRGTPPAGGTR